MVNYEKIFEPYYEGGWEAYPLETTLVTAGALNAYDAAIMHIEDYLDTEVDPNDNLAETYSDEDTYEAGDYRIYNGVLYKCLEDIDEAEEFDPTKWESCLVTDEMATSGGTTVIANPVGTPTDDLETIQIGETIYDIPGGGGGNANIWTGTQAEYEAQASQIADDTVVLITDDEEHTQAFDIYSTDEHVIGTWIDGITDVFEKTINVGNMPNNSFKAVPHGINGMSLVIALSGGCTNNAGSFLPLPYPTYSVYGISIDVDTNNINIGTNYDRSPYTGYITIRYLK